MNDELKGLSDKLDEIRQEHIRGKYENLSYIFGGFTLAMVGLTLANPHRANIVVTIVFFIMSWVMWFRARRVTAR
jgi:Flp pilus assembly protein TadB